MKIIRIHENNADSLSSEMPNSLKFASHQAIATRDVATPRR